MSARAEAAKRRARLASHRLTARADTIADAARWMLAVQAQEFWGGRWALALRTRGAERHRTPGLSAVDRAFDDGTLVRAWTQRGTIHIVPAEDVEWMLGLTADRQLAQAAGRHRQLGIDDEAVRAAENAVRIALRGGARLTRAELFAVFESAGESAAGQRGVHLLQSLVLRRVIALGPTIDRGPGLPRREQYVVLAEDWLPSAPAPADPLAEFFVRYAEGHGPASAEDFAWWSGLALGQARRARDAAQGDPRIVEIGDGEYSSAAPTAATRASGVIALPSFDEYYISYADRGLVASEAARSAIGPGVNGMVRPTLIAAGSAAGAAAGRAVGTWTHSLAVGRHSEHPVGALFDTSEEGGVDEEAVAVALADYRSFLDR